MAAPPCFLLFRTNLVGLDRLSKKSDVDEVVGESAPKQEVDSLSLLVRLKEADLCCCVSRSEDGSGPPINPVCSHLQPSLIS